MLLIALIAFIIGNYSYIGKPFDPDRNPCGLNNAEDYPYLYFTTPIIDNGINYNYRTVCVKECPSVDDDMKKF